MQENMEAKNKALKTAFGHAYNAEVQTSDLSESLYELKEALKSIGELSEEDEAKIKAFDDQLNKIQFFCTIQQAKIGVKYGLVPAPQPKGE